MPGGAVHEPSLSEPIGDSDNEFVSSPRRRQQVAPALVLALCHLQRDRAALAGAGFCGSRSSSGVPLGAEVLERAQTTSMLLADRFQRRRLLKALWTRLAAP